VGEEEFRDLYRLSADEMLDDGTGRRAGRELRGGVLP
jgi:hypothetical protein